ncbi:phosphatase PAP2 family protein [Aquimarina sp. U1-2]|uniref:phosphatase PAP2 family protein n=1 Tax=Aquimarina sp. U1-2 TaxID=2823141 RepID=UPI001AECB237|nr:phosphatase PAP2 family protein [Aquimarina sp. U1-2]MBP2832932.1 phosphatase PAP2 family protein [Aquimarina sp. U1-2]
MSRILEKAIHRLQKLLLPVLGNRKEKIPYFIVAFVALLIVVLGINIFVELTEEVIEDTLTLYDQRITEFILSYRSPFLTQFFKAVTAIGEKEGYLIILGVCILLTIFIFKRWKYIAQIVVVLFLAAASNVILKRFIDRARPGIDPLVIVKSLSYPSGHAMASIAFYGFLIYLLYRFKMNIFLKFFLILMFLFLILSIGISRIYLGVHFPSDVAGGYIAGLIWVFFCIFIFNLIEVFRKDLRT